MVINCLWFELVKIKITKVVNLSPKFRYGLILCKVLVGLDSHKKFLDYCLRIGLKLLLSCNFFIFLFFETNVHFIPLSCKISIVH
jgi:hypothetical protein